MATFAELTAQLNRAGRDSLRKAKREVDPEEEMDLDEDEQATDEGMDDTTDSDAGPRDTDESAYEDQDDEDEDEDEPPLTTQRRKAAKRTPSRAAHARVAKSRRAAAPSSDDLLKSLLFDEQGNPSADADVIEVSDVLTNLTHTIADSYGAISDDVHDVRNRLDQALPLVKSMAQALLIQQRQITRLSKSLDAAPAARQPANGVTFALHKSRGTTDPAGLQRSLVFDRLNKGFNDGILDRDEFRRFSGALDSQGVAAVVGMLPEHARKLLD